MAVQIYLATPSKSGLLWIFVEKHYDVYRRIMMSLEPGGRADKQGNRYENWYLAKLLVQIIREDLESIVVEPLGPSGVGAEYSTIDKKRSTHVYQCKASNGTKDKWSMADLQKHKVFDRAKAHIKAGRIYHFISPCSYGELAELCERALTNQSVQELITYQLTNNEIRDCFKKCAEYFQLDPNQEEEAKELRLLLSKCRFEQVIQNGTTIKEFESFIGTIFHGNVGTICSLLESYVSTENLFGQTIAKINIREYLRENGIDIKNIPNDTTAMPVIERLNQIEYSCIGERLIHRKETDVILQAIEKGESVLLHGAAGSGKSGCVEEVCQKLEEHHILYLKIKLDRYANDLKISPDEFGKRLGFLYSPVTALAQCSGQNPCVLVLDQLDSLRWTSNHSSEALEICKEMIRQVRDANYYDKRKISIVFVVRTFDYENDTGIKSLFSDSNSNRELQHLQWRDIALGLFSDDEVKVILGEEFEKLNCVLKKLLHTPSSLYVWSRLNSGFKKNDISSQYQLINQWWSQIIKQCEKNGVTEQRVTDCKDRIVTKMYSNMKFTVLLSRFTDFQNEIQLLASNGLLTLTPIKLSFAHQSFWDYFLIQGKMKQIDDGEHLCDIFAGDENQTPNLRYQFLALLQNVAEEDQRTFVNESEKILQSDKIRYYFKCAVFEIMGQIEEPEQCVLRFAQKFYAQEDWKQAIYRAVYLRHPQYITRLKAETDEFWMDSDRMRLLHSISDTHGDFVVEKVRPLWEKNTKNAQAVYNTLCKDPIHDTNNMFKLRMELIEQNIDLSFYLEIRHLLEALSDRMISIMKLILNENIAKEKVYWEDREQTSAYCKVFYKQIICELFPVIQEKSIIFNIPYRHGGNSVSYNSPWFEHDFQENYVRAVVNTVKEAMSIYASNEPEEFLHFAEDNIKPETVITQEIILSALQDVSDAYSNQVLMLLISLFPYGVFVTSGADYDCLDICKHIIEKFTVNCSSSVLKKLESEILCWKEPREKMIDEYKWRREVKQNKACDVYYAYWGQFQKKLLRGISISRLSKKAKKLVAVLDRNDWVRKDYFNIGFRIESGGFENSESPIGDKADRLSNKNWIEIINPQITKQGLPTAYRYPVSVSPDRFASIVGIQAEKEPERFAKLLFAFDENVYPQYIVNIIRALNKKTSVDIREISFDLLQKVICRFGNNPDTGVRTAICNLIETRAEEEWSGSVIEIIKKLACGTPEETAEDNVLCSNEDAVEEHSTASLRTNAFFSVRESAIHTIAALLFSHSELYEEYRSTVQKLVTDTSNVVRFAAVSCVAAYFNYDEVFAKNLFDELICKDIRIIGAKPFWSLVTDFYRTSFESREFYRSVLINAIDLSNADKELTEITATIICALAIYENDDELFSYLISHTFTDAQKEKICEQAVYSFNEAEYHEKSQEILRYFIHSEGHELVAINRLFYDERVSLQRDKKFIVEIIQACCNRRILYGLMLYIEKSNEKITEFIDIFKAIVDFIPKTYYHETEEVVQCIHTLLDCAMDDPEIRSVCLDVMDVLFQNNESYAQDWSNLWNK